MEMDTVPNGNSPSSTTTSPAVAPTSAAAAAAAAAISPNTPSSKLNQLSESMKLEHQFLRVPFEHYKKTIRANHRVVEKEVNAVINGVVVDADDSDVIMSSDDAVHQLNSLVSRLQGLKRKHYKKTVCVNHRVVEKEVNAVINGVIVDVDDSDVIMSSDDAVNQLNSLVSRLQGLKRKNTRSFVYCSSIIRRLSVLIINRVVEKEVNGVINGVIVDADGSDVIMSSDDAVY
ncbi:putative UDP-glycosyltransferase 79B6-like isoform 1 [Capsicum annuum]|nr:putative UDP-glycosyltransferase 79B6-like isoform 1 [Capsicum annuum]